MQVVPSWMGQEALETLNKGYLQTGETPRDMFVRLSSAASKYLGRPDLEQDFFSIFLLINDFSIVLFRVGEIYWV